MNANAHQEPSPKGPSGPSSKKSATNGGTDKRDGNAKNNGNKSWQWPWYGQFALAVFLLLFAGTLLIGLPVYTATKFVQADSASAMNVWGPMIAVLVGLTMMTVSGIFIFMTFRIDRGTKLEAKEQAEKTAEKNVKKNVKKIVKKIVKAAKTALEDIKICVEGAQESAEAAIEQAQESAEAAKEQAQKSAEAANKQAQKSAQDAADKVKQEWITLAAQIGENLSSKQNELAEKAHQAIGEANVQEMIRSAVKERIERHSLKDMVENVLREEANQQKIVQIVSDHVKNMTDERREAILQALDEVKPSQGKIDGWWSSIRSRIGKKP